MQFDKQYIERLLIGLKAGDSKAELEARIILANIISLGSIAILADVFRGIILAWDEDQIEWDSS